MRKEEREMSTGCSKNELERKTEDCDGKYKREKGERKWNRDG